MDSKRDEVLEHLYIGSETREEQERVRQLYLSKDHSEKAKEEWALVEELHLVPTMGILWRLGKACEEANMNLYSVHDCRDSVLMCAAGIPYDHPEKPEETTYNKFYSRLYSEGPMLICEAEIIFDVQKVFTDCFMPGHIFKEGFTRHDKNGAQYHVFHPAHFLIVPMNDRIENISGTALEADYCIEIYKGVYPYPSDDGIPICTTDYKYINDRVWQCRLFAMLNQICDSERESK